LSRLSTALLALLCYLVAAGSGARTEETYVLFGAHSSGPKIGFTIASFDLTSGVLGTPHFLLECSAPAYFVLSKDDKLLYACNSEGSVSAYRLDSSKGQLAVLTSQPTGGGDPSYISLDRPKSMPLSLITSEEVLQHGRSSQTKAWENERPSFSTMGIASTSIVKLTPSLIPSWSTPQIVLC